MIRVYTLTSCRPTLISTFCIIVLALLDPPGLSLLLYFENSYSTVFGTPPSTTIINEFITSLDGVIQGTVGEESTLVLSVYDHHKNDDDDDGRIVVNVAAKNTTYITAIRDTIEADGLDFTFSTQLFTARLTLVDLPTIVITTSTSPSSSTFSAPALSDSVSQAQSAMGVGTLVGLIIGSIVLFVVVGVCVAVLWKSRKGRVSNEKVILSLVEERRKTMTTSTAPNQRPLLRPTMVVNPAFALKSRRTGSIGMSVYGLVEMLTYQVLYVFMNAYVYVCMCG
jgi:hypothetical protein